MPNTYVQDVLAKLQNNPTAQDLDFFIEAHSRIGYLAATAEGLADQAEAERKYEEANAYVNAKLAGERAGERVSASDAERAATVATKSYRDKEVKAREAALKLKNLLNSIEQAINGIKFLGRADGAQMMLPRR